MISAGLHIGQLPPAQQRRTYLQQLFRTLPTGCDKVRHLRSVMESCVTFNRKQQTISTIGEQITVKYHSKRYSVYRRLAGVEPMERSSRRGGRREESLPPRQAAGARQQASCLGHSAAARLP
ncbi:hypothetical protein MRX96_030981 [Rhipicephalus microplus]